MSPSTPRLALLKSEEPEFQAIASSFGRHAASLELVQNLEEAAALVNDGGAPLQGILYPLRIRAGLTGISACVQSKAHPVLSLIPALGISPTKDRLVIDSFYGAGADCVFVVPFEAEQVLMQAVALTRVYQIVKERLAEERDTFALSSGVLSALNSLPEPLVIFDTAAGAKFLNSAAKRLVGIEQDAAIDPEKAHQFFLHLEPALETFLRDCKPRTGLDPKTLGTTVTETDVVSASKQRIPVRCTLTPLVGERGGVLGASAHLQSFAELEDVKQSLLFAQRSHALSLLASAGMLKFLEQQHGGFPVAPVQRFISLSQKEDARCRLSPILTALIEILDSIVPPGLTIITKMGADIESSDLAVALRPSDALQLFGHILLHATRTSGIDGEVTLSAQLDTSPPSQAVVLLCTAEQGPSRALISRDLIGEATNLGVSPTADKNGKLLVGLDAAQVLADRYHVRIEFKTTATSFKVRLRLPLC
jgi:PAS domain-containing protein